MMVEFRRIKTSLFLMLVLHFTATANRQLSLSFAVRGGGDATLSCENMIDGQRRCEYTTWLFNDQRNRSAVALFEVGRIKEHEKTKSGRLSVAENCSLVIKKVSAEDAGRYTCRQFIGNSKQHGPDSAVDLSVVTMTEHKNIDVVTFTCSVSTYGGCDLRVKWLYGGRDVDKDNKDVKTSQTSPCSASVQLLSSHYIYTSKSDSLKCEVTDGDKVQLGLFSSRPSAEKPGEDTTITAATESTTTTTNDFSTELKDLWWRCIIAAVVLVAVIIIVVKIKRRKTTTQESETQMDDNTADPGDGLSYASISFTKNSNVKTQVQRKNDDCEGDAVTYTTVKATSTDPSNLYATVS